MVKKTAQNTSKADKQTARGQDVKTKRGVKRPSAELEEMLRLANVAEPGADLPPCPSFGLLSEALDWISELPDPGVRLELHEHLSRPAAWLPRPFASLADLPEHARGGWQCQAIEDRYEDVRRIRDNFRRIVHRRSNQIHLGMTKNVFTVGDDNRLQTRVDDPFIKAVNGIDVRYLRECPICNRYFYAARMNQSGCGPQHSSALYKRQQRANKKKARKSKRA